MVVSVAFSIIVPDFHIDFHIDFDVSYCVCVFIEFSY